MGSVGFGCSGLGDACDMSSVGVGCSGLWKVTEEFHLSCVASKSHLTSLHLALYPFAAGTAVRINPYVHEAASTPDCILKGVDMTRSK